MEVLALTINFDHDLRLVVGIVCDCERPELLIFLYSVFIVTTSDKSFGVIYGVGGVPCGLILSALSDKTLTVTESDIRGCDVVAHIV